MRGSPGTGKALSFGRPYGINDVGVGPASSSSHRDPCARYLWSSVYWRSGDRAPSAPEPRSSANRVCCRIRGLTRHGRCELVRITGSRLQVRGCTCELLDGNLAGVHHACCSHRLPFSSGLRGVWCTDRHAAGQATLGDHSAGSCGIRARLAVCCRRTGTVEHSAHSSLRPRRRSRGGPACSHVGWLLNGRPSSLAPTAK